MLRKITFISLFIFAPLWADQPFEDPSTGDAGKNFARITYTDDGNRFITRDETVELGRNMAVTSGTTLSTDYRSFAEVELIDGSLIQVNGGTVVEFQAINDVYNNESLTVVNMTSGSLFFHISSQPDWLEHRIIRIDSLHGSVYIESAGLYRIDQKDYQMKLYVYRGVGELAGERDSSLVRSGEFSAVSNLGMPLRANAFNSYYKDSFTTWAYSREPHLPGVSARYVDPQIARYSYSLDNSGAWRYSDEMGTHVWVPRVDGAWRPYYDGYWSSCGSSLSWVGHHDWSWVTGHYGRWGWSLSFGWHWIPDSFYAPAWVAWTVIDGLLGWCPLGRWNRPFYYDRYNNHNTYITNHFNDPWTYREPNRIHVRNYRNNARVPLSPRTVTQYTSRPIRVTKASRADPMEYTRAVRKPTSAKRAPVSKERTTRSYVDRSSHTRAQSRYKANPQDRSYSRVSPQSSSRSATQSSTINRSSNSNSRVTTQSSSRSEPATRNSTKPSSRTSTQPTTRTTTKPATRSATKPATRSETQPSTRTTTQPTNRSKPATRSTPKPATGSSTKPTKRTEVKPKKKISSDRVTSAPSLGRSSTNSRLAAPQRQPIKSRSTASNSSSTSRKENQTRYSASRSTSRAQSSPSPSRNSSRSNTTSRAKPSYTPKPSSSSTSYKPTPSKSNSSSKAKPSNSSRSKPSSKSNSSSSSPKKSRTR